MHRTLDQVHCIYLIRVGGHTDGCNYGPDT